VFINLRVGLAPPRVIKVNNCGGLSEMGGDPAGIATKAGFDTGSDYMSAISGKFV
jgi:hypothetical protein